MLRQASVSNLISNKIHRGPKTYIVITMRRYPRYVHRELRDEYLTDTTPSPGLLADFLSIKRKTKDHNGAFEKADFERRFELPPEGLRHLERLARLSKTKDVYLVCQCELGNRCHRELLLILAREWFGAKTEKPKNRYPHFEKKAKKQEPFAIAA